MLASQFGALIICKAFVKNVRLRISHSTRILQGVFIVLRKRHPPPSTKKNKPRSDETTGPLLINKRAEALFLLYLATSMQIPLRHRLIQSTTKPQTRSPFIRSQKRTLHQIGYNLERRFARLEIIQRTPNQIQLFPHPKVLCVMIWCNKANLFPNHDAENRRLRIIHSSSMAS